MLSDDNERQKDDEVQHPADHEPAVLHRQHVEGPALLHRASCQLAITRFVCKLLLALVFLFSTSTTNTAFYGVNRIKVGIWAAKLLFKNFESSEACTVNLFVSHSAH